MMHLATDLNNNIPPRATSDLCTARTEVFFQGKTGEFYGRACAIFDTLNEPAPAQMIPM